MNKNKGFMSVCFCCTLAKQS